MSTRFLLFLAAILVTCSTIAHCAVDDYTDEDHDEEVEPGYDPSTDTDKTECLEADHQVFSECGNNICQNSCARPQNSLVCRGTCISGCVCEEGYLRNSLGNCVLPEDCDSCKENEEFTECGNHGCLNTCLNPNLITVCLPVPGCFPGCICSPGFLRNPLGQCVPESECQCGENEVYSESGKTICENTCKEPRKVTYCKAKSEAGCGCMEGYLKNSTNVCVLPENCDGGCDGDVNAYFDKCGDPCPRTCNNYKRGEMVCKSCIQAGGCKCKKGYVRDINKKCVLPSKCPQCGPNEFFDCGSACDTTCATLGDVCPIVNIKCNEMCYCVGGYARDKNNVCIPIKQCPPKFTCARNQTYDACPYTCPPEETCESHLSGIAYSCAAEPEPRTCVPKCKCSAGFLRKVNGGDCIKPNQCCNDPNAEIVSCPNPCPGGTCIAPAFADCKAPCKIRGCQCKSGYVKDATGKCILLSKCRCGDPNSELVSCPNPCPGGTCDQPEFSSCQNVTCKPFGCQCKRGYVKDSRGKCIPVASCPRKCNINEVWNKCPGYCTFDKDCSALLGDLPMCAPPPPDYVCSPRCECIENYVRINGTCAPRQKCCEDPNSELVECPNPCPGGTCDSPQFADCDAPCKLLGCQCKNGYVLDQNKKCIPLDKCPPKVCNRNEFYNPCPKHCEFETNCLMIFDARIPSCPPPPPTPICQPRCQCLSGFVRINDECADFDACCNDPNAVITPCPMDCPETCEGIPPAPCQINCVFNSCKCKPGYVKHNGMCILREDCPPECPPNEFYNNCGTECPPTCGNRIPRCSKMCSQGCFCKDGYIRRFEGAECIPIEKCPITPIPRQCVQNEVFRRCPSPCPPEKTCDSMFLGVEPLCPVQLNPPICNPSCLCVSGYVRNHNNACVLPEKCCTDPNSELVDNPNCCPGGTCAQPEFSPCKRMCPAKGCQCKKGFLKKSDTDSTCVPKSCNCGIKK